MLNSLIPWRPHASAHSRPKRKLIFVGLVKQSNVWIPAKDVEEEFLRTAMLLSSFPSMISSQKRTFHAQNEL